jgi:hypothetical protein
LALAGSNERNIIDFDIDFDLGLGHIRQNPKLQALAITLEARHAMALGTMWDDAGV